MFALLQILIVIFLNKTFILFFFGQNLSKCCFFRSKAFSFWVKKLPKLSANYKQNVIKKGTDLRNFRIFSHVIKKNMTSINKRIC